ncbi:Holliday junction branch migration protein RuvA [Fictibacillus aquaticus]|uniref:Holliday junction branch migration complex subunit RuvA n=1 Tax=Fictibacillus aquaticus TaxID=2021314 RepID=A0A235F9U5_9BACL|nr:Holliday junction branch migration protein RuvA [Fictibacillus aquaticus]OYD58048.1 Holliday junction branch migration protein RuvA [Fictibacillus aquaticus]
MIECLSGRIEHVAAGYISVQIGGIGYKVFCPNPFAYRAGSETKVYTYQYVREDILALYGFSSRQERDMFIKLLNVSGIGPKGAMAIMAYGQPEQVACAIEDEDERFLTKFPGVGKKTARQIILDLKGKLADFTNGVPVTEGLFSNDSFTDEASAQLDEAVEALIVLGYAKKEIQKILPDLKKETGTADEYVKRALRKLMTV